MIKRIVITALAALAILGAAGATAASAGVSPDLHPAASGPGFHYHT